MIPLSASPDKPALYSPAPRKTYALEIGDDGSFAVWIATDDGLIPHSGASGRWADVNRPAVPEVHRHIVHSDGSLPIGRYAAQLAAETIGRPDLYQRLERDRQGRLTCPHCRRTYTRSIYFSDHLRLNHSDTGAAVVAWSIDFPAGNGGAA